MRTLKVIASMEERLVVLRQFIRNQQTELALEALDRALLKVRAEKRLLKVESEVPQENNNG